MNVTGVEWRDSGNADTPFRHPPRRPRPSPEPDEEDVADVVEIHDAAEEETADGLDQFEP